MYYILHSEQPIEEKNITNEKRPERPTIYWIGFANDIRCVIAKCVVVISKPTATSPICNAASAVIIHEIGTINFAPGKRTCPPVVKLIFIRPSPF